MLDRMLREIPRGRALKEKLRRLVASTIQRFNLIREGDRVLVAISGGKDSLVLLKVLAEVLDRSPFKFSLHAVTVDAGFTNFDFDTVSEFVRRCGATYEVLREDEPIFEIIKEHAPKDAIPCVMCSRLRRGILYTYAAEHGFDSIALGHHLEDLAETLLLNLFFNGKVASMPAKLISDDRRNVVIRPLCRVPESWIDEYARIERMPVQEPRCPLMPEGKKPDTARVWARRVIEEAERISPHVRYNLLAALSRVEPRFLLVEDVDELKKTADDEES